MYIDYLMAVAFARDVYRRSDRPLLPEGWSVYCDCPEEYQKDGYFGSAYIHFDYINGYSDPVGGNVVIAHRGTDNFSGILEDAEMDLFKKIPQQFYDGAIPFIQFVFDKLNEDYPCSRWTGIEFSISFTGHSLGATLTELSEIKYYHYFDNLTVARNTNVQFSYLFDSPGSYDLVRQMLENKEITQKDIDDGSARMIVFNAEIDAINTCMKSSCTWYLGIRSYMGKSATPYISLSGNTQLPYDPSHSYYFSEYTLKDQHPIANIYDRIMRNNYGWQDISVDGWPIGFHTGYRAYKTYYGSRPPEYGLYNHNVYWDRYTDVYWEQNPNIHNEYNNDKYKFKDYYYRNVCYYYDGYSLPKELPYKFNIADMQRIEQILSVEGILMQSHTSIREGKKEEKLPRLCCGISFFRTADNLQKVASSVTGAVGRVVTEAGEELERVISAADSVYREGQQLFFFQIDRFVNGDGQRLVPTTKSQTVFGIKK